MPAPKQSKHKVTKGRSAANSRIVIYGEGGIGKTTLCSLAPKPLIIDLQDGSWDLDVDRIQGVDTFDSLLEILRDDELLRPYETIVVDTATDAQDLAIAYACRKNGWKSIEDPGYGKGYRFAYEQFELLLAAGDRISRSGKRFVLVCHDTTVAVPHPSGEDYLCYQPSLMNAGKTALIRDRVKGWCDHLLFLRRDVSVDKNRKAKTGERYIWPQGDATFWAKSRRLRDEIEFSEGSTELWDQL
ncbi:MAG: ATP-binding protein [Planctomycetota bacterium]